MERRIIITGIIDVTNSSPVEKIKVEIGNKSHRLEKIILKALEEQLPKDCYSEKYTGRIVVEIKLEKNSIKASEGDIYSNNHSYKELLMEGEV